LKNDGAAALNKINASLRQAFSKHMAVVVHAIHV
jgi:hypothetical protein